VSVHVLILRADRQSYYRVLSLADDGKEKSLVNFVGKAVERSLTLYLDACTKRTSRPKKAEEWIPLSEAAHGTPYSQEYLSMLARKGQIDAVKRGRNWLTTRKAIENYISTIGSRESI
jgi:hypothetical protein